MGHSRSELRYADGLARHQTAVQDEQSGGRVKLERRATEPDTPGQVVEDPALTNPVGHEGIEGEGGGDRGALKVSALTRGVLGQSRDGDVETGETSETAEDEEAEEDVVDGRTHAQGEGDGGGGEAERDLAAEFC